MLPFMWSLGSTVGAAMGGYLAQPSRYYPAVFPPDGLFGQYPYLLPNLVAVVFIILAIIQGYFFMKETNPRFQSRPQQQQAEDLGPVDEYTPLQPRARRSSALGPLSTGKRRPSFICGSMPTMSEPSFDLRKGSVTCLYDITPTVSRIENFTAHDDHDEHIKVFNRTVVLWIIAIVIMCYHQMAFASLLPIYLLDEPEKICSLDLNGGLGYTVHDVGDFMSINGIIALVIQGTIFPIFVGRVGVWKSVVSLIILCPVAYAVVPFLSLLSRSGLPFGIYAVLFVQNLFIIIIYPCLLIALKNAAPSSLALGKINGLAMSASSGARTIAPPLSGIIYSAGGSAIAWWSMTIVALMGTVELFWISRPKDDAPVNVENVLRRPGAAPPLTYCREEEEEGQH
jgi:hypothetical protein